MRFDKDHIPDKLGEADEVMIGLEGSTLTWHQEDNTWVIRSGIGQKFSAIFFIKSTGQNKCEWNISLP